MDEKRELLADVRAFLEWQQQCGADVWKVEDWNCWKVSPVKKRSQQAKKVQPKSPPSKSEKVIPQVSKEKPSAPLEGIWGKLLHDAPVPIDLTSLSSDGDGLKKIKGHQKSHCRAKKHCSLGGGRAQNPVLVLEGHQEGLTLEAREMLGKMIDKVLKIPRSKMYWLPYPMDSGCGLCANLFLASLECISPKVVLVMGRELENRISMGPYRQRGKKDKQGPPVFGERIHLNTSTGFIPGVWTHHPTALLNNSQGKQDCFQHLNSFVGLMRQHGI